MEKIKGLAGFAPALLIGSRSTAYLLKVCRSEGREEICIEEFERMCIETLGSRVIHYVFYFSEKQIQFELSHYDYLKYCITHYDNDNLKKWSKPTWYYYLILPRYCIRDRLFSLIVNRFWTLCYRLVFFLDLEYECFMSCLLWKCFTKIMIHHRHRVSCTLCFLLRNAKCKCSNCCEPNHFDYLISFIKTCNMLMCLLYRPTIYRLIYKWTTYIQIDK